MNPPGFCAIITTCRNTRTETTTYSNTHITQLLLPHSYSLLEDRMWPPKVSNRWRGFLSKAALNFDAYHHAHCFDCSRKTHNFVAIRKTRGRMITGIETMLGASSPIRATWRFMGSYKWSYKSPNMAYNYSYPTYNPTYKYP